MWKIQLPIEVGAGELQFHGVPAQEYLKLVAATASDRIRYGAEISACPYPAHCSSSNAGTCCELTNLRQRVRMLSRLGDTPWIWQLRRSA